MTLYLDEQSSPTNNKGEILNGEIINHHLNMDPKFIRQKLLPQEKSAPEIISPIRNLDSSVENNLDTIIEHPIKTLRKLQVTGDSLSQQETEETIEDTEEEQNSGQDESQITDSTQPNDTTAGNSNGTQASTTNTTNTTVNTKILPLIADNEVHNISLETCDIIELPTNYHKIGITIKPISNIKRIMTTDFLMQNCLSITTFECPVRSQGCLSKCFFVIKVIFSFLVQNVSDNLLTNLMFGSCLYREYLYVYLDDQTKKGQLEIKAAPLTGKFYLIF